MSQSVTLRFSERVGDYTKYRPSYPDVAVEWVLREAHIQPQDAIADVGAGTGIMSGLLLRHGAHVYAVEPDPVMRAAAEAAHGGFKNYHSVDGTAESTKLADESVKLVTVAQAFHWFDFVAAKHEFARILKPDGRVALFWNTRRSEANPFHQDYEAFFRTHGTDYREVSHTRIDSQAFDEFFAHHRKQSFANRQDLNLEGLLGRIKSCSFVPHEGEDGFDEMITAARALFEKHADNDRVTILYDCEVYIGAV